MRRFVFAIMLLVMALFPAVGATSYNGMTAHIQRDAARSNRISIARLGKSSSGSRSIWLVRVARPGVDERKTVRVLLLCRQHGDEPASTEAALSFLNTVAAGKSTTVDKELKGLTVYIVPMVNPDGADAMTRENGAGVDLNRDWLHFDAPETRAVMRAVGAIKPQFVADLHSWDAGDTYHSTCIESPREGDGDTATSAPARLSDTIGSSVLTGIRAADITIDATSYGAGADDTLCHRYFPLTARIPAVLFETRPGPNNAADLADRTRIACTFINSTLALLSTDRHLRAKLMAVVPTPKSGINVAALFKPVPAEPVENRSARPAAPAPWLSRVPRPIWFAFALYGLGTVVIGFFKPKASDAGSLRVTWTRGARNQRVARAVFIPNERP